MELLLLSVYRTEVLLDLLSVLYQFLDFVKKILLEIFYVKHPCNIRYAMFVIYY